MAHLVEERDDVVVAHERGFLRSRLREVGDHGGERVAPRAVRALVAGEEAPDGCVRVFGLCWRGMQMRGR